MLEMFHFCEVFNDLLVCLLLEIIIICQLTLSYRAIKRLIVTPLV